MALPRLYVRVFGSPERFIITCPNPRVNGSSERIKRRTFFSRYPSKQFYSAGSSVEWDRGARSKPLPQGQEKRLCLRPESTMCVGDQTPCGGRRTVRCCRSFPSRRE